jgi:GTPase SAR1 family protein
LKVLISTIWQGLKIGTIDKTPALDDLFHKLEILPQMPQLKDANYINTVRQAIIPTWAIAQVRNAYETFKVEADNNTLGDDGDWGGHFLGIADQILSADYVIKDSDMIRLRRQTFMPQEVEFNFNSNLPVKIVDLGGQLDQRATWEVQYLSSSAIIYMCSLSDFDQMMDETGRPVNKLQYAFQTFIKTVVENPKFAGKPCVVLLNKSDVLAEKLKTTSFKKYFPDCDENEIHSYEYAISTIAIEYESIDRVPRK